MGGPGGHGPTVGSARARVISLYRASGLRYEVGAGDRSRTGYLNLGKVALYQVSYARSAKLDSRFFRRLPRIRGRPPRPPTSPAPNTPPQAPTSERDRASTR